MHATSSGWVWNPTSTVCDNSGCPKIVEDTDHALHRWKNRLRYLWQTLLPFEVVLVQVLSSHLCHWPSQCLSWHWAAHSIVRESACECCRASSLSCRLGQKRTVMSAEQVLETFTATRASAESFAVVEASAITATDYLDSSTVVAILTTTDNYWVSCCTGSRSPSAKVDSCLTVVAVK